MTRSRVTFAAVAGCLLLVNVLAAMMTDREIYLSASVWSAAHGELAVPKARIALLRRLFTGDEEGCDAWRRMICAIMAIEEAPHGPPN